MGFNCFNSTHQRNVQGCDGVIQSSVCKFWDGQVVEEVIVCYSGIVGAELNVQLVAVLGEGVRPDFLLQRRVIYVIRERSSNLGFGYIDVGHGASRARLMGQKI